LNDYTCLISVMGLAAFRLIFEAEEKNNVLVERLRGGDAVTGLIDEVLVFNDFVDLVDRVLSVELLAGLSSRISAGWNLFDRFELELQSSTDPNSGTEYTSRAKMTLESALTIFKLGASSWHL
jgi:hypothetical protein